MDHDTAIGIEGLGKRYRLGELMRRGQTLGEKIMALPRGLARRARDGARHIVRGKIPWEDSETPPGTFWALRDIDLKIKRGQAVGIIGRNGAGKSTLLKILSRITVPTKGQVQIRGRVSSLLEIGTGFHEQLTGRENIYLNGSILGMRKVEIDRQFDAIVDFSGVERFLDTPVKRYSSGMRVRLGFAVAAHLDPEILIVDEVLAVGDAEFQKKCLGKMGDVATEGRTVLFVSHNMQAIKRLCDRGVLLKDGRVQMIGDASDVVESYLSSTRKTTPNTDILPEMHHKYPPGLEVFRIEILDRDLEMTDALPMDEPFQIRMHYRFLDPEPAYRIGLAFRAPDSTRIAQTILTYGGMPHLKGEAGKAYSIAVLCRNPFLSGHFTLDVVVKTSSDRLVDMIEGVRLSVTPPRVVRPGRLDAGLVWLDARWKPQEESVSGPRT